MDESRKMMHTYHEPQRLAIVPLIVVMACASAAAQEYAVLEKIRLKTSADEKSKAVITVDPKKTLILLEVARRMDWVQLNVPGGGSGWVHVRSQPGRSAPTPR